MNSENVDTESSLQMHKLPPVLFLLLGGGGGTESSLQMHKLPSVPVLLLGGGGGH